VKEKKEVKDLEKEDLKESNESSSPEVEKNDASIEESFLDEKEENKEGIEDPSPSENKDEGPSLEENGLSETSEEAKDESEKDPDEDASPKKRKKEIQPPEKQSDPESIVISSPSRAGKKVYGAERGVIVSFDADGKSEVSGKNMKHFLALPGVTKVE
jgi:hypothetical protein